MITNLKVQIFAAQEEMIKIKTALPSKVNHAANVSTTSVASDPGWTGNTDTAVASTSSIDSEATTNTATLSSGRAVNYGAIVAATTESSSPPASNRTSVTIPTSAVRHSGQLLQHTLSEHVEAGWSDVPQMWELLL